MFTQSSKSSLALTAALGVGAGLLANVARKAAVQAPTALAGDWAEALAAEHRAALAIFDLLEATDDDETSRRTTLLAQLKQAIGKHAFQEENVIYPALRDHGLAPTEAELTREHADVKHFLFQLSALERGDPQWLPTVRALRSAIEPHMTQEENEIFPQLRERLSDDENRALARAMNKEGFKLA
jgi:hemerythrin-like domain-containing protein